MPNWKKVIVSGSDASLNSLNVTTYISASTFNGNFTGSLQGSSSYALTSSYALYAAVAPNLGTTTTFTQAASASTWMFTHNLNTLTPQITVYDYGNNIIIPQNVQSTNPNITTFTFSSPQSGYAVIGTGGGLVITGSTYNFSQTSASSTWLIEHPLNTKTPIVQIYDANYNSILTEYISGSSNNLLTVNVGTAQTGYAVLSNGGNLFISGSSARLTQSIAAVTWSFTHSLNTKYPVVQVYDANDSVIVPATITAIDTNTTQITFATPTSGVAVAEFSGIQGLQDNTVSSSYAVTASSAIYSFSSSYAATASLAISASYASASQNTSDILLYVQNNSGAQINKGSVVRISGAAGDNPKISLADWTNDNNSANTLGLTTTDIADSGNGYVMTEGKFIGYDTSTPGWVAGQLLFLSSSGSITGSAPQAPLHGVRLGQVLRVQQNNGSIYIRIDNGYELGELHDIVDNTTTLSFGDMLVKSGSVWINSKQLTGSYGLTGSLQATSFTGSLFGTSSWAQNTVVAPAYTLTSSFLTFTSSVNATTGALNATTGALNATTGALNSRTGSYATTGSNSFIGNQTVTGDLRVQGNLIAQTFIISSSVSYFTESFSSGSTKFGDDSNDLHQFTGSVRISGSLDVTGSVTSTYGFTGSLFGTSSWAQNAVVAPYYVLTSSFSTTSASISSRVTNLESTASAFVVASASFSSSIVTLTNASASFAAVSTSYSTASGSLSSRVTVLETASGSLSASVATLTNASASFALQSGSNSTRFTILELASGSLSASVATLFNMSASYAIASGSDSARITRLEGTASAFAIASASFSSSIVTLTSASASLAANSGSNSVRFTVLELASGSLSASVATLINASSSFAAVSTSYSTTSASIVANYVRNSQTSSMTVLSSSYALTASYASNVPLTASYALTSSVAVSSSYALTASYALNGGSGGGGGTNAYTYTQAASSSTWNINHALNSKNINITVYDFGYNVVIPQNITNTDANNSVVTFSSPQSGFAVFNPGGLFVTGSTSVLSQSAAAVTWSFNHNLNSRLINIDVYGSDYSQIIPARVTLMSPSSSQITFATATSGYAVATVNGFSGSITSAQNVVVQTDATNTTRYMTFTDVTSGLGAVYADPNITLNPSTNALTVGSLTETSTISLKTNIKDFVTPLAKFMALKPVSYKWKENKRKDIGFIAEHVQELFPEIVADDGKSMSYTKLTPILIDIVQRQQETIDEMRKELKAIKRHIDKH